MDHQNTIPERNLVLIHIYITFSVCQKELIKAIWEWRLYYSNVRLILSPAQCFYTPSYVIENIQFPLFENEIFDFFPVSFDTIQNSTTIISYSLSRKVE